MAYSRLIYYIYEKVMSIRLYEIRSLFHMGNNDLNVHVFENRNSRYSPKSG